MNELTITLLFLGVPGVLCVVLTQRLIGKVNRSTPEYIVSVFTYSIFCYITAALVEASLLFACSRQFHSEIFVNLLSTRPNVDPVHLISGMLASIPVSGAASYITRNRWVNQVGFKLGVSCRVSEEDIWACFHNPPKFTEQWKSEDGKWVQVKDFKANKTYYGYIPLWSDSGSGREFILQEVTVFELGKEQQGEALYEVDRLYISRKDDDFSIEIGIKSASSDIEEKESITNGKEGRSRSKTNNTEAAGRKVGRPNISEQRVKKVAKSQRVESSKRRSPK